MSQASGKIHGNLEQHESQPTELMSLASSRAQGLKKEAIRQACEEKNIDQLVRLTESSGGLLDDSLRRTACKHCRHSTIYMTTNADRKGPILLGYEQSSSDKELHETTWRVLPRHRDEDQVQLDVNRAFVYYPNSTAISNCLLKAAE